MVIFVEVGELLKDKLGVGIYEEFDGYVHYAVLDDDYTELNMNLNEIPHAFLNKERYAETFKEEIILIKIKIDEKIENKEEFVKQEIRRKVNDIIKFIEDKKKLLQVAEETIKEILEEIEEK